MHVVVAAAHPRSRRRLVDADRVVDRLFTSVVASLRLAYSFLIIFACLQSHSALPHAHHVLARVLDRDVSYFIAFILNSTMHLNIMNITNK